MATTPPSHSTYVDIDEPDAPPNISTPYSFPYPGTQVRMLSPALGGSIPETAGKLQPITTTRPNEMLGVDIMGPLPRSTQQNEHLLVFVDYYTRWVDFFPMRHATRVATILRKEILTRWGVPDFILSDRGSQLISSVFKDVCDQWSVTH